MNTLPFRPRFVSRRRRALARRRVHRARWTQVERATASRGARFEKGVVVKNRKTRLLALLLVAAATLLVLTPLAVPAHAFSWCCERCDIRYDSCFNNCAGNPGCEANCDTSYWNCIANCPGGGC